MTVNCRHFVAACNFVVLELYTVQLVNVPSSLDVDF